MTIDLTKPTEAVRCVAAVKTNSLDEFCIGSTAKRNRGRQTGIQRPNGRAWGRKKRKERRSSTRRQAPQVAAEGTFARLRADPGCGFLKSPARTSRGGPLFQS